MFTHDPLLGNSPSLEQLERQNELYAQKLQELKAMPPHHVTQSHTATPLWDEINHIVISLGEQEKAILVNDKEYCENSITIQELVNEQLILLVKGKIEAMPEGKSILEQQLALVRRISKTAKEETARRDALFREYMTEHSDMTWQQFMEMKNGKSIKQKKQ